MSISNTGASSLAHLECFWATAYPSSGTDGSLSGHSLQVTDRESQILLHYLLYLSPQPTLPALGTCLYMMCTWSGCISIFCCSSSVHIPRYNCWPSLDPNYSFLLTGSFSWLLICREDNIKTCFCFSSGFFSLSYRFFIFLFFFLILTMSFTGSHRDSLVINLSVNPSVLIFCLHQKRVLINRE